MEISVVRLQICITGRLSMQFILTSHEALVLSQKKKQRETLAVNLPMLLLLKTSPEALAPRIPLIREQLPPHLLQKSQDRNESPLRATKQQEKRKGRHLSARLGGRGRRPWMGAEPVGLCRGFTTRRRLAAAALPPGPSTGLPRSLFTSPALARR